MEAKLLSAIISDRCCYDEIRNIINPEDFSDLGQVVLKKVEEYYNVDINAPRADKDILLSRVRTDNPAIEDMVGDVLDNLPEVSIPNVTSAYVDLRLSSLSKRIAAEMATGKPSEDVATLVKTWTHLKEYRELALARASDTNVTIGLNVAEVVAAFSPDMLVHLYPQELNDAIGGGAPPGTHVVVFARPEAGKSMFCINMAANFVMSGKTALYIGNEDPAAAMKRRLISNLTTMTSREVEEDAEYAQDMLRQWNTDRLVFADVHPGSVYEVRSLVEEHRPDVVIVDQIRNLRTPKAMTKVESLEYVAQEMRNVAKEFGCVVISVTQAGDSADGKAELDMGDIDFSNTGIPATADIMIGIGKTVMLEKCNMRVLSLPKNKLSGNHDPIQVSVQPEYSKVG